MKCIGIIHSKGQFTNNKNVVQTYDNLKFYMVLNEVEMHCQYGYENTEIYGDAYLQPKGINSPRSIVTVDFEIYMARFNSKRPLTDYIGKELQFLQDPTDGSIVDIVIKNGK